MSTMKRKPPAKKTGPAPRVPTPIASDLAAVAERRRFPSLQLDHPLEPVFKDAVAQAQRGKGAARHGRGQEFMKQTWLETANAHGAAFLTGQAEKKMREAIDLPYAQARTELLGTLVYAAMAILKLDIDNGSGPRS